jgi:hypothetical protein
MCCQVLRASRGRGWNPVSQADSQIAEWDRQQHAGEGAGQGEPVGAQEGAVGLGLADLV